MIVYGRSVNYSSIYLLWFCSWRAYTEALALFLLFFVSNYKIYVIFVFKCNSSHYKHCMFLLLRHNKIIICSLKAACSFMKNNKSKYDYYYDLMVTQSASKMYLILYFTRQANRWDRINSQPTSRNRKINPAGLTRGIPWHVSNAIARV